MKRKQASYNSCECIIKKHEQSTLLLSVIYTHISVFLAFYLNVEI